MRNNTLVRSVNKMYKMQEDENDAYCTKTSSPLAVNLSWQYNYTGWPKNGTVFFVRLNVIKY